MLFPLMLLVWILLAPWTAPPFFFFVAAAENTNHNNNHHKRNMVPVRDCHGTVRHVHLAVGYDPSTEMTVSFASTSSAVQPPPKGGVLIGLSPDQLDILHLEDNSQSPTGYNVTVSHPNKANYEGNLYVSPYYHHVTVTGLQPSTTYFYQPVVHKGGNPESLLNKYNLRKPPVTGSSSSSSMLEEIIKEAEEEEMEIDVEEKDDLLRHRELDTLEAYNGQGNGCPSPDKIRTFRTAPLAGKDDAAPVTFAVVGDLGQFPHSQDTLARMIRSRDEIDAIILAGDIAYTRTDQRRWDTFFDFLDDYPMADHKPMQIVPGNHDIDKTKNGTEIFMSYEYRFRMPQLQPAKLGLYDYGPPGYMDMDKPPYPLPYEYGNAYYAYTYGPARFVMVSSYSSMEPDSTQCKWLKSELDSVDRHVTPWLIVVLHTPVYNTFSLHRHDPQIEAAKKHLEPLFVEHGVNLVFTGHIHAYLRTSAVSLDQVDPTGPVHITVGAGGRKCEAPFYNIEPEPWVKVRDATMYGYGMFRIFNRTHAQWDWIHTGQPDDHHNNQLHKSNQTLPAGPALDKVVMENQYFL